MLSPTALTPLSELQGYALVIALFSGNKVKKLSQVQLWSRCAAARFCVFAFAEVNGLGECVLNKNAQEGRRVKREGVNERERITRSEPLSLEITR